MAAVGAPVVAFFSTKTEGSLLSTFVFLGKLRVPKRGFLMWDLRLMTWLCLKRRERGCRALLQDCLGSFWLLVFFFLMSNPGRPYSCYMLLKIAKVSRIKERRTPCYESPCCQLALFFLVAMWDSSIQEAI